MCSRPGAARLFCFGLVASVLFCNEACHSAAASSVSAERAQDKPLVVRHARRLNGGLMTVVAEHGVVTGVLPDDAVVPGEETATRLDAAGRWLLPAFIDSHVHAAYARRISGFPNKGVAGVVDLGMPLASMGLSVPALMVMTSGPLLTAPGGYPTRSWGRDGYGLAVSGPADAAAAVEIVAKGGAKLVKIALAETPSLDEATARAIVEAAHAHGLKVAVHALTDADAALAGRAGCDVLAHTPVEPLSEATLAAWGGRAVVSTLAAFGARPTTIANLTALRERGATVLYGTDFGNTTQVGIASAEVFALLRAGLDMNAIVDAATRVPAAYWGFDGLGEIAPGKRASFFLTADPPTERPDTLAVPIRVFVDGVEYRPL